jgi:hypothetical protein
MRDEFFLTTVCGICFHIYTLKTVDTYNKPYIYNLVRKHVETGSNNTPKLSSCPSLRTALMVGLTEPRGDKGVF